MTVASASLYPVTIHWIVGRSVSKSRASVLIATLTTVVSRIDMIGPRTTTLAMVSSRRSSLPSGSAAIGEILLGYEGEEDMVHELGDELVVEGLAGDQGAREDH